MPSLTATQTFDRLQRAHDAWTRGGATISVFNQTERGQSRAQFRLDLDGAGGATLRVQSPAQGKLAATDQAYVMRGAVLVGVDYPAREALRRPAPDRGSVGLRLTAALGALDDAVGFLGSPEVRWRYLGPLRNLGGWRVTPRGLVRQTVSEGRSSLTRLELDPSGRLRNLHVVLPDSRTDWSFTYGPVRPLALPKGLRMVEAFTARPRPPYYADKKAKGVVESLLRSTAHLQTAVVSLDGQAKLWIGGSKIRYESRGSGFAYDGKLLTIGTPGVAYRGRAPRGAVIDQVATLLGSVDPLVRTFLVRATPYLELFPPEARVRVPGTMAAAGQSCDVLDVEAPRFRATVFVRKTDALPLSIETSARDTRGREISLTRRSLAWSSVGAALPPGLFALKLRRGQTILPLPRRVTGASSVTAP